MKKKISGLLLFSMLALSLTGCKEDSEAIRNINTKEQTKEIYVDFKRWQEGRLCSDIAFRCLPENRDPSWQEIPLKDGLDTFELTPEVMKKRQEIIQRWRDEEDGKVEEQDMRTAAISEAFYDRVEEKRFLIRMEKSLEEEFPGFWRDTPKKVRYRWIRRAMNKAKRFGYKSKGPGSMVELCARIGLDFDKDPKWDYITEYILKDPKNNISVAINYIDWTIFNKTHARTGTPITDWLMRRAHPGLPWPKKPYPKLND